MTDQDDSVNKENWSPRMGVGAKVVVVLILLAMAATGTVAVIAMLK